MLPETKHWRAFINVASCLNCLSLENKLTTEVCLGKCTASFNFLSVKTQLCKFSVLLFKRVCLPCICEHNDALGVIAKRSQVTAGEYFSARVRFAIVLAYM